MYSSGIPFIKSNFGISFGFTNLLNTYCIICITISVIGIYIRIESIIESAKFSVLINIKYSSITDNIVDIR